MKPVLVRATRHWSNEFTALESLHSTRLTGDVTPEYLWILALKFGVLLMWQNPDTIGWWNEDGSQRCPKCKETVLWMNTHHLWCKVDGKLRYLKMDTGL